MKETITNAQGQDVYFDPSKGGKLYFQNLGKWHDIGEAIDDILSIERPQELAGELTEFIVSVLCDTLKTYPILKREDTAGMLPYNVDTVYSVYLIALHLGSITIKEVDDERRE